MYIIAQCVVSSLLCLTYAVGLKAGPTVSLIVIGQRVTCHPNYCVRSGLLMGDVALGMKSASRAMNACMHHLRCLRVEILQVSKWRCMVSYCVCMYVCIHLIAYFLYLIVCIMHECIHVSMHSFFQLHTIDMLLYVCLYLCRKTVGAVPAPASAATATTFCSANIYTDHPEGVPRRVFSLCERIQVQHENKDHYRSNGKRRWERWDARRRRS